MPHDSVAENRPTLFRFKIYLKIAVQVYIKESKPESINTMERINISGCFTYEDLKNSTVLCLLKKD